MDTFEISYKKKNSMLWHVVFCLSNNTEIQPYRVTNEFSNVSL